MPARLLFIKQGNIDGYISFRCRSLRQYMSYDPWVIHPTPSNDGPLAHRHPADSSPGTYTHSISSTYILSVAVRRSEDIRGRPPAYILTISKLGGERSTARCRIRHSSTLHESMGISRNGKSVYGAGFRLAACDRWALEMVYHALLMH